jgi:hypothetical protein
MVINTNQVAAVMSDAERQWVLCGTCVEARDIVFVIETVCPL